LRDPGCLPDSAYYARRLKITAQITTAGHREKASPVPWGSERAHLRHGDSGTWSSGTEIECGGGTKESIQATVGTPGPTKMPRRTTRAQRKTVGKGVRAAIRMRASTSAATSIPGRDFRRYRKVLARFRLASKSSQVVSWGRRSVCQGGVSSQGRITLG
jgi:hypothetical protein